MPKIDKYILPKGTKVPDHIAIIPDGNRRWARARGLHTLEGHRKGFEAAVKVSRAARDLGVHTVTLWGFSTENWDRAKEEIGYLMKLYEKLVDDYLKEAKKEKVRIVHLGRKDRLPEALLKKIVFAEESTKDNIKHIMNIAIDYGGQDDIIRATQAMIRDGVKPERVDKKLFEKYVDTKGQPYPYVDLIIRTSGEQRTSGFLLWQSAYAETYWENDHFPDFTAEKLKAAILDYSRRRRRFGGNDAEEHLAFDPEVVARLELAWWRLRKIPEGTRFRDYAFEHIQKQYGLSKTLAKEAAKYLVESVLEENNGKNWERAKGKLKKFYKLIKDEVKLAFEPSLVASLEVKFNKDLEGKDEVRLAGEAEETARELYAEVYRISLFQAAKAAHLRVMANIERNLAERGFGEKHWERAEDYLQRFYRALKERVA
jgi:undecaprenyl diphosphate synthase